jgi:hypothetical protein
VYLADPEPRPKNVGAEEDAVTEWVVTAARSS